MRSAKHIPPAALYVAPSKSRKTLFSGPAMPSIFASLRESHSLVVLVTSACGDNEPLCACRDDTIHLPLKARLTSFFTPIT